MCIASVEGRTRVFCVIDWDGSGNVSNIVDIHIITHGIVGVKKAMKILWALVR